MLALLVFAGPLAGCCCTGWRVFVRFQRRRHAFNNLARHYALGAASGGAGLGGMALPLTLVAAIAQSWQASCRWGR
jgi:hypothetical protein